jgi:hypothetical protein
LLDFLAKRKNSSFPERKPTVSASGKERLSGWKLIRKHG